MPKRSKTKVRLNRADAWRTVLTDTAPYEVPIIVSNDGFYKNLRQYDAKSDTFKKFVGALVHSQMPYTIPLRYSIVKDTDSIRTLSLVHPNGQVRLAELYSKYDQLITEYAGRSPFSIRKPTKVGTAFFYQSKESDRNKYKATSVDTEEIDHLVRNPASYFSYSGFDRLYRFFTSDDHTRLEKKYSFQMSLDVAKCFDSIYTHSIAWATKSKELAKENRRSLSFGNKFDQTMQELNYGETSGICIGPEASRIFAEIILAEVDQNVATRLADQGVIEQTDYDCRRYVDNYYVFANTEGCIRKIKHEISIALREYNLHLNDTKTELIERPFYTRKSLVIDRVNASLQKLWDRTLEVEYDDDGKRFEIPFSVYKHRSLFGAFTREIKAACYASGMGYDSVSNYVIGAIKRKIVELADSFSGAEKINDAGFSPKHYRQLFLFLLDVGYYFFTLHPTVASSLRLSHATVRVGQHLRKNDEEGFDITKEATLRWTHQLSRSPSFSGIHQKRAVIPIEFLNVLLCLQEFSDDGSFEAELLDRARLDDGESSYFHLVVRLFVFGNHAAHKDRVKSAFEEARKKIRNSERFYNDSELAHLLLDLLACPHIDLGDRSKLLREVWSTLKHHDNSIGNLTVANSQALVTEIQQQHWFVRWEDIDLLNMIEKKELSAVYA